MGYKARSVGFVAVVLLASTGAWGATIPVDSGESIQAAIDSASSGDVIDLAAASFDESIIVLNKDLTITASAGRATIAPSDITGNAVNATVLVDGSNVTMSNVTVDMSATACTVPSDYPDYPACVWVQNTGGSFTADNVVLTGGYMGVTLHDAAGNLTMTNSTISHLSGAGGKASGIYLHGTFTATWVERVISLTDCVMDDMNAYFNGQPGTKLNAGLFTRCKFLNAIGLESWAVMSAWNVEAIEYPPPFESAGRYVFTSCDFTFARDMIWAMYFMPFPEQDSYHTNPDYVEFQGCTFRNPHNVAIDTLFQIGFNNDTETKKTSFTMENCLIDNYYNWQIFWFIERTSCLFTMNQCTVNMGWDDDSHGTMCLFRFNTPISSGASLTVKNSIILKNSVEPYDGFLIASGAQAVEADITIDHCFVGLGAILEDASYFTGDVSISDNISERPTFKQEGAGGDFHLAEGSSAIDSGTDSGAVIDFDGDARPYGIGIDIGFDEFTIDLVALSGIGVVLLCLSLVLAFGTLVVRASRRSA